MVNLSLRPVGLFVITHCALFYVFNTFIADVSYSWLSVLFSAGGFKAVSETSPPQATVQTAASDDKEHSPKRPTFNVFSCPQEGYIKVFQQSSAVEHHLSLEACSMSPERHTLIDLAKQQYATLLSEGIALLPSLQFSSSVSNSNQGQSLKEGWALKKTKRPYRFRRKAESLPGG